MPLSPNAWAPLVITSKIVNDFVFVKGIICIRGKVYGPSSKARNVEQKEIRLTDFAVKAICNDASHPKQGRPY